MVYCGDHRRHRANATNHYRAVLMMQRRSFLKSLGMLAGAIVVAPMAIAEVFKKKPPLDDNAITAGDLTEAEFYEWLEQAFTYGQNQQVMFCNESSASEWRNWLKRYKIKTLNYNTPHGTIRIL